MDLRKLIDEAAKHAGTSRALADELGMHPNRLAEWKRGAARPDATEILYMARRAGLPEAETLAEIEAQLDPRFPGLWSDLLGKLRAAASVAAVALFAFFGHSHEGQNGFDKTFIGLGFVAYQQRKRSGMQICADPDGAGPRE